MASWGGRISARIQQRAPRIGRPAQVVVRITVSRSGTLAAVSLLRSSGDAAADRAAIQAVRRAGRFPRAPGGLTDPAYSFSLPIRFR